LPTVAEVDPPPDMLENFIESNQVKKLPLISGIKKESRPSNSGRRTPGRLTSMI
jgi:hypothetical protein